MSLTSGTAIGQCTRSVVDETGQVTNFRSIEQRRARYFEKVAATYDILDIRTSARPQAADTRTYMVLIISPRHLPVSKLTLVSLLHRR
jgi:hypothetical protein